MKYGCTKYYCLDLISIEFVLFSFHWVQRFSLSFQLATQLNQYHMTHSELTLSLSLYDGNRRSRDQEIETCHVDMRWRWTVRWDVSGDCQQRYCVACHQRVTTDDALPSVDETLDYIVTGCRWLYTVHMHCCIAKLVIIIITQWLLSIQCEISSHPDRYSNAYTCRICNMQCRLTCCSWDYFEYD